MALRLIFLDIAMQNQSAETPRLAVKGIRKAYPAVVANDDVNLSVMPGEIHAVLGENGAGKSTLMKLIYGVTHPDAGEIRWEGKLVTIKNPAQAREMGVTGAGGAGDGYDHDRLVDEVLTVPGPTAVDAGGDRDLEPPKKIPGKKK